MKDLRRNYTKNQLTEENLPSNPFKLFETWFDDAQNSDVLEPNAMVLSTANKQKVDSRTVLLKGLREEKFVFFTNYESNKARQLLDNPYCTLLFLWLPLERQIIIRGKAVKVSDQESEEYFNSRPRESQIGAWVSEQSKKVANRKELEDKLFHYSCEFEGELVMKPVHWGGFEVSPYEMEFWQGRENRLHDRFLYESVENQWDVVRLQP